MYMEGLTIEGTKRQLTDSIYPTYKLQTPNHMGMPAAVSKRVCARLLEPGLAALLDAGLDGVQAEQRVHEVRRALLRLRARKLQHCRRLAQRLQLVRPAGIAPRTCDYCHVW